MNNDQNSIFTIPKLGYLNSPEGQELFKSAIQESQIGGLGSEVPNYLSETQGHDIISPDENRKSISKIATLRQKIHQLVDRTKTTDEVRKTSKEEHQGSVRRKTNARLLNSLKLNARMFLGDIRQNGEENYDKVPAGSDVIFVVSHIKSDVEMQAAMSKIGESWDIAIANHSSHHSFKKNRVPYLGMMLAGKDNFYPINQLNPKSSADTPIRRDNFENMAKAFDNGKAVVIAVSSPVYTDVMPEKPGVGAVLLAQYAENPIIIPVGVDIQTPHEVGRGGSIPKSILDRFRNGKPSVKVSIGEPFAAQKLTNTRSVEEIRAEGGRYMRAVAEQLPSEKRGVWGVEQISTSSPAGKVSNIPQLGT